MSLNIGRVVGVERLHQQWKPVRREDARHEAKDAQACLKIKFGEVAFARPYTCEVELRITYLDILQDRKSVWQLIHNLCYLQWRDKYSDP